VSAMESSVVPSHSGSPGLPGGSVQRQSYTVKYTACAEIARATRVGNRAIIPFVCNGVSRNVLAQLQLQLYRAKKSPMCHCTECC